MTKTIAAFALTVLVHCIAVARPRADNPVTLIVASLDTVYANRGDTVLVRVPLRITPGYHVNANPASSEDYIPLSVRFDSSSDVHALKPEYPKGESHRMEELDETLLVYDQGVTIPVPVVVGKEIESGLHTLKGTVEFQACDDRVCFMPDERHFSAVISVK